MSQKSFVEQMAERRTEVHQSVYQSIREIDYRLSILDSGLAKLAFINLENRRAV